MGMITKQEWEQSLKHPCASDQQSDICPNLFSVFFLLQEENLGSFAKDQLK